MLQPRFTFMKKKWNLSVKGKRREVVVDGSASGENVIRVDGRLAARPLDADETQRAFIVDGVAYSLRRSGAEDFELTAIGTGPPDARTAKTDMITVGPGAGRENVFTKWLRAMARLLFASSRS
ncbi:MAG TPA: hypothetical protein VGK04_00360 [Thermoanaerobaculia bacterium]|jgi:hypothetical protein